MPVAPGHRLSVAPGRSLDRGDMTMTAGYHSEWKEPSLSMRR